MEVIKMSKFDANNIGNNLIKVDGNIIFKLRDVLDNRGISRYKLSTLTNIRYDTICNYCNGKVTLMNLEYIKIFCSILNCNVEDIIEYKK